jgi:hypothetical protein
MAPVVEGPAGTDGLLRDIPAKKALYCDARVLTLSGHISLQGKQPMRAPQSFAAVSSAIALGCAVIFGAAPALAYTACNGGDCWHTDSKVHYSGVKLSFHNDKWADSHKSDANYHWHEADADHDSAQGYWNNGEWHHK